VLHYNAYGLVRKGFLDSNDFLSSDFVFYQEEGAQCRKYLKSARTVNTLELRTDCSQWSVLAASDTMQIYSNKGGLPMSEANKFDIPSHLLEPWPEFEKMRKLKKRPMTDRARKMLVAKLEKLAPGNHEKQVAIMDQSIFCCWLDVYQLKEESYGNTEDREEFDAADFIRRRNEGYKSGKGASCKQQTA
jgi:hypothetical protein